MNFLLINILRIYNNNKRENNKKINRKLHLFSFVLTYSLNLRVFDRFIPSVIYFYLILFLFIIITHGSALDYRIKRRRIIN
jgi:hypothetical protein